MEMALAMIDKIIEEHEIIKQNIRNLERQANDIDAIGGLKKIQEASKSGKLDDKQGLQKLQGALQTIYQELQAHFNREEKGLIIAFEGYGNKKLTSTFTTLLIEHEDLRNWFARSRKCVSELIGDGISHQVWEAEVCDMQAHISRTRQLLEVHADMETELLQELRSGLKKQGGN